MTWSEPRSKGDEANMFGDGHSTTDVGGAFDAALDKHALRNIVIPADAEIEASSSRMEVKRDKNGRIVEARAIMKPTRTDVGVDPILDGQTPFPFAAYWKNRTYVATDSTLATGKAVGYALGCADDGETVFARLGPPTPAVPSTPYRPCSRCPEPSVTHTMFAGFLCAAHAKEYAYKSVNEAKAAAQRRRDWWKWAAIRAVQAGAAVGGAVWFGWAAMTWWVS